MIPQSIWSIFKVSTGRNIPALALAFSTVLVVPRHAVSFPLPTPVQVVVLVLDLQLPLPRQEGQVTAPPGGWWSASSPRRMSPAATTPATPPRATAASRDVQRLSRWPTRNQVIRSPSTCICKNNPRCERQTLTLASHHDLVVIGLGSAGGGPHGGQPSSARTRLSLPERPTGVAAATDQAAWSPTVGLSPATGRARHRWTLSGPWPGCWLSESLEGRSVGRSHIAEPCLGRSSDLHTGVRRDGPAAGSSTRCRPPTSVRGPSAAPERGERRRYSTDDALTCEVGGGGKGI